MHPNLLPLVFMKICKRRGEEERLMVIQTGLLASDGKPKTQIGTHQVQLLNPSSLLLFDAGIYKFHISLKREMVIRLI